jgi:hypothetical protein
MIQKYKHLQFSLEHAMPQVVTCQPVTAEAHVQSQASICRICGGKSGNGTGFSPSTSVFAYRYHSTNASYLITHLCSSVLCEWILLLNL